MRRNFHHQKKPDRHEISSGGIVFYESGKNNRRYLLLKHSGSGRQHIDVPKGHQEEGETLEETAIREVSEESGLPEESLRIIKRLNHVNTYRFRWRTGKRKTELIEKDVFLFLIKTDTQKVTLSDEHIGFRWVFFEELEHWLTFETSFPAFLEAEEYLNQK